MAKQKSINQEELANVEVETTEKEVSSKQETQENITEAKPKKSFLNWFGYFIPSLVVIVTLFILYAIKGIAPFGTSYVTYIDGALGYIPVYYSIWDVAHSGGSIIYNFFLGAGSNVYGSLVQNAMYSPLTWLIVMIPRSYIPAFMSFFLMIKMALMALTMFIFIKKVFKNTTLFMQVLFSVLWAFSGWLMVSYTNLIWLDNMIIVPLLMLSLKKLFDDNKVIWYVVTLTISLIFSFYLSFMLLLFVIFCGSVGVMLYAKPENRKRIVTNLIWTTLVSLFLALFSVLPALFQSLGSHRIAGTTIAYENPVFSKAIVLLMSAFPIFSFIKLCMNYKKDNKMVLMFALMFLATTVTVLIEGSNRLWHTGSYQSFPYRFAFLPIFIMLCGGLYYWDKFAKDETKKSAFDPTLIFLFVVYILVVVGYLMFPLQHPYRTIDIMGFLPTFLLCCLGVFNIFNINRLKNIKLRNILIIIFCFIEVFTFGIQYIGTDGKRDSYNEELRQLKDFQENVKFIDDGYKYKFDVFNNFQNYPYITRTQSLSTWMHIISSEQVLNSEQMGYVTYKTQCSDEGGTAFSDMLYNVSHVVTDYQLDDSLYNLVGTYKEYYMYDYKYTLPLGMILDSQDLLESIPKEKQLFDAQNYVYNEVFNQSGNIINTLPFTITERSGDEDDEFKYITVTFETPENGEVYFYTKTTKDIEVSTKTFDDKSRDIYTNTIYNVGVFNGSGSFEIVLSKDEKQTLTAEEIVIGYTKTSDLENLSNQFGSENNVKFGSTKMTAKVTATEGQSLYIPITYDENWTVKVNGKTQKVNRVLNTYIGVELEEGENVVEFAYVNHNLNKGLIISIATLVILAILWVVNHFTHFMENKWVNTIGFWTGLVVLVGATMVVYCLPFFKTIFFLY